MLELRGVSFATKSRILIDAIDLQFQEASLNVIVGPNGAGKSTLLKLLSRQLKPSVGQILFNGKDLAGYSLHQLARHRAVLSQQIDLSFSVTVRDLVMMGRYPHFSDKPRATDHALVQEILDYFDLSEMQERDVLSLSGGERQRAHLARVVAQIWEFDAEFDSPTLLLDEPLSFLDVYYQLELLQKLKALIRDRKMTVIAIVHDLNLAAKYGDYLCLLHQGRLLSYGRQEQVMTPEYLQKAYRITPAFYDVAGERRLSFF